MEIGEMRMVECFRFGLYRNKEVKLENSFDS